MIDGDLLAELRGDAGLSQTELGERIGVQGAAVSKYETGENTPPLDTLVRMAEIFEVNLDFLCGRTKTRSTWESIDHALAEHEPGLSGGEILERIASLSPARRSVALSIIDELHKLEKIEAATAVAKTKRK